jgi:putative transposase
MLHCLNVSELKSLIVKHPHRYSKGEDLKWYSPPASEHAAQFGFDFHIQSDDQINWVLYRNITFLEDYYRNHVDSIDPNQTQLIKAIIQEQPGITLRELLYKANKVSADEIYQLIATEKIYVDLKASLLVEPERCRVFCDQLSGTTYNLMISSHTTVDSIRSPVINLIPNTPINWDGQSYNVVQIGHTEITLRATEGDFIDLPISEFESKIRQGKITASQLQQSNCNDDQIKSILLRASSKDLEEANHRYRSIEPILLGQALENSTISERTLRDWLSKYRQAQQKCGYGYIGLLSCSNKKGNRNRKLPQQTLELIDKFITQAYETHKQKRKYEVYGAFNNACVSAGISPDQIPSYKTFINEIKRRSGWEQTKAREGHRAAYPQKPFYWELELTTPRHGDRPFEIGHIDHTKMDIELRCSLTGQVLGRPWATFLVDAYSRSILAVYLTFDLF